MKIRVNTKFNIGDAVYAAEWYGDFYAEKTPSVVTGIVINVNSYDNNTMYFVDKNGFTDKLPENWLFNTYEECVKWCDENN